MVNKRSKGHSDSVSLLRYVGLVNTFSKRVLAFRSYSVCSVGHPGHSGQGCVVHAMPSARYSITGAGHVLPGAGYGISCRCCV